MLNSILIRALCGAMILCAPALAIIPPEVDIRIGGADLIEPYHYAVKEGQLVTVSAHAGKGDLIWLFASPMDASGEVDYSIKIDLIKEKALNGTLSKTIKVPEGLGGQSFSLLALAFAADGDSGKSSTIRVDVKKMPPPVNVKSPDAVVEPIGGTASDKADGG